MEPGALVSLIQRHTGIKVHSHRTVLEGWDNVVLLVNGSHVFRFTRRPDVHAQLRKEAVLLPVLGKHLSLPVPQPLYVKLGGEPPHFMGYQMIPGEQLREHGLRKLDQTIVAETLDAFIRELHAVPHEGLLGKVPYHYAEEWREGYQRLWMRVEEHISPRLPETAQRNIESHFEGFLENTSSFRWSPRLVHRDLSSDHILHHGNTVTGVIDWGDACYGDPVFDLTGLLHDYGDEFTRMVQRDASLSTSDLPRAQFYLGVMPFYEALLGLETSDFGHLENVLKRIEQAFRGR